VNACFLYIRPTKFPDPEIESAMRRDLDAHVPFKRREYIDMYACA